MTLLEENAELQRRLAAADERLRESEARNRLLVKDWVQAEWETGPTGVVLVDSPSWRSYTGQTLEEWLGYGWLDAIHPDDRAYAERQWREAVAAQGLVNAEFRLRAPDGGWRWTNVRAAPLLDADGSIEKWLGLNIDIDDRTRAEAELRESEERYRALFASMDEAYAVVDVLKDEAGAWVDFRFVEVNPAFIAHTGMPWPIGQTATQLLGEPNPRWTQLYGQTLDTGRPIRVEEAEPTLDRVFDLNIFPLDRDRDRVAVLFTDITERKRAEAALRESEERQAFLLKLSDALRSLNDPVATQGVATRMLGARLRVDRCYYAEFNWPRDVLYIHQEYVGSASFSVVGEHPISAFQDLLVHSHRGEPLVCDNIATHPIFSGEVAAYRERGTDGFILIPLVKQGIMAACICVTMAVPRAWSGSEIELVREVGDRTWEASQRARAESGLQESEERFQQFARASAAGLWIRNADTLSMEFVSPAVGTIYGVAVDALLGDVKHWAAMIVPEDREVALGHLAEARDGQVAVHDFRIQRPSDGAFRWIRNTDFPLRDDGHVPRIGGIAEDVTEAKLAAEHSAVLLAELQHRVRNIMAIIRAIASRSAERAGTVPEYAEILAGRLLALSRVQALLTRGANVSVGLRSIIVDEVGVQAHHEGQYDVEGPDIEVSPKIAEVLTLVFHELSTNALKYGALSVPDGRVTVRWEIDERRGTRWLSLDWTERGGPERPVPRADEPRREGFGSELIEGRMPYELDGRGSLTINPDGARCHFEFPLTQGASVLETGAPQRATVFGGVLDMTGEPDLKSRRVLVVEDDYYQATDMARALRGAGAEVLGPCGNEAAARERLAEQRPDAVLLDINLGDGASFKIAERLKDQGVPFAFVTGYDQSTIPAEFDGVTRLEKPVLLRQIVNAAAELLSDPPMARGQA